MTIEGMITATERDITKLKIRSLLTNSTSKQELFAQQIRSKERVLAELKKMASGEIEYR